MESLRDWWNGVLQIEGATWIIYPSILVALILVAYYVIQAVRNMAIGGTGTEDHLGTFRKMRDEGVIGADEYKKVAGLVPLPEVDAKEPTEGLEGGVDALSEAAKAAIRKAALKKADESGDDEEESDAVEEG
ncbi:hypothetical protein [Mariniblastus fucicola]|uniref:Uncharacterized protein n=1 Tax=Mariniblastus fucicola TaxID=980251 RepID=A0A5B9PIB9_9BACT|nr:hypothetical protein [Mariniblastus fucicola]QEG24416.1 hypothetical protein MFFC18_43350 [Mariniblastus fucicola]